MSRPSKGRPTGLMSLAAFVLVFPISALALGGILTAFGLPGAPTLAEPLRALPAALAVLAAALGAGWLSERLAGRRGVERLGLSFHAGMYGHLILGLALGIALAALVVGAGALAGVFDLTFRRPDPWQLGVRNGAQAVLLFFALAAWEEVAFRGVLQRWLAERFTPWQAIASSAGLFGLLHALMDPYAPPLAVVGVALAGAWLGRAYEQTGTLWWPIGLHLGWNLAEGFVFGLPVSGHRLEGALASSFGKPGLEWLSGGRYGPEAGVLGLLGFALALFVVTRVRLARVDEAGKTGAAAKA